MGMRQTTKIRRVDIDKAAQHFDEAPEVQPEEVTRKEAVRILGPKIKEMLRKGYNWEQIAERLKGDGISIEPDLLASYHRASVGGKSGRAKRARRASGGPPTAAGGSEQGKPTAAAAAATERSRGSASAVAVGVARQAEGGSQTASRPPTKGRTDTSGGEASGQ
jgi:hypothetical protein